MKLGGSVPTPACAGLNHADFSIDGRFAIFTCEFNGSVTKIDLVNRKVLATLRLSKYFARPEVLAVIDKPGKKPKKMPDPARRRRRSAPRPACRRTSASRPTASASTSPT